MKRGRGNILVLTPEQIARYQSGITTSVLAEQINCTPSTVLKSLKRQGVAMRTRRQSYALRRKNPQHQLTPERLKRYALVVRLRDLHQWPFAHIAEELEISTSRAWEMYHTAKRRALA